MCLEADNFISHLTAETSLRGELGSITGVTVFSKSSGWVMCESLLFLQHSQCHQSCTMVGGHTKMLSRGALYQVSLSKKKRKQCERMQNVSWSSHAAKTRKICADRRFIHRVFVCWHIAHEAPGCQWIFYSVWFTRSMYVCGVKEMI